MLRGLLRSLSGFIAEGAGGVLPKMGWDLNDFNTFINRSETDTAWESYQRHKREQQHAQASGPSSSKRPADDELNGARKRPRVPDDDRDGYTLLVPMNSSVPPVPAGGLYPQSSNNASQSMFNDLLRGPSGSPMFVPPTSSPNSSSQYPTPTATSVSAQGFSSTYVAPMNGPMNLSIESPVSSLPVGMNSNMPGPSNGSAPNSQANANNDSAEPDPKTTEAMKLIQCVFECCWVQQYAHSVLFSQSYHLENYKRNSQYCLPSSLRPTLVQRYDFECQLSAGVVLTQII